ncbi:hypothetical protein HK102_004293 [Quaeritorhiza haematococci]|nr:hypothetical protein HK102_004293 [Quaeritorhiza haematococci]
MSLSNEEAEFVSFASLCQAVTSRSDAEPNESEGGHPTPRRSDRIRFLDKLSQLLATEKGDVVACALHVDRKNSPTIYVASTRAIATVKPLAEFVFAECQAAANHERSLAESRNRIKEEVIPRSVEVLSTRMKRPHGRRALESMDLQSIRVSLIAAKAEILERVNARLHKVRAIKRTDQLFVKRTGGGKPIDVIGENFEVFVDDYIIYIRQLQELLPTLHESPQADLFLLVQIGLIAARLYESAAFPSLAKLVSEPKFSKFIRKSAQCEIAITTFTNHLTKKGIKHFPTLPSMGLIVTLLAKLLFLFMRQSKSFTISNTTIQRRGAFRLA